MQPIHPKNAYLQTLCTIYPLQTVDSGFVQGGVTEDWWATTQPIIAYGPGVLVAVVGLGTYYTGSNGCITFTTPTPTPTYTVIVYTVARLANGTYVRMHDGPSNSTTSLPGSTYVQVFNNVTFWNGSTVPLYVGNYGERWTLMAALNFSLNRYADSLDAGTQIHVSDRAGENPVDPENCEISLNYSNNVTADRSYISFEAVSCLPYYGSQRKKFIISHGYGHAYGHQIGNVAFQTPADTDHSANPAGNCLFGGDTPPYVPYGNFTKEWSSVAIREGWAHFVSARIWNDAASSGSNTNGLLRWDGNNTLEAWNGLNPPEGSPGGRLVNTCCSASTMQCATSLNGAGVLIDWLRAFWDMHADSQCIFNKSQMANLYGLTISWTNLNNGNFFPASQSVLSVFASQTCQQRWAALGCHNGIDRQGQVWAGC